MCSGIYCIENKINGKRYIGQSINIDNRRREHFRTLRQGAHGNRYLQNAWNKYGENNFEFYVLIFCEKFELTRYEQFFVDKYNMLYNIAVKCVDSTMGVVYSKESKEKFRVINSGKNNPMYGRKHSDKTSDRMSELANGNKNPAKLTWEKVRQIKNFYMEGARKNQMGYSWDIIRELSKRFNVGQTAIYNIISGKSWKEGANHSCRGIGQNGGLQ